MTLPPRTRSPRPTRARSTRMWSEACSRPPHLRRRTGPCSGGRRRPEPNWRVEQPFAASSCTERHRGVGCTRPMPCGAAACVWRPLQRETHVLSPSRPGARVAWGPRGWKSSSVNSSQYRQAARHCCVLEQRYVRPPHGGGCPPKRAARRARPEMSRACVGLRLLCKNQRQKNPNLNIAQPNAATPPHPSPRSSVPLFTSSQNQPFLPSFSAPDPSSAGLPPPAPGAPTAHPPPAACGA